MVQDADGGVPIHRPLYHVYGLLPSDTRCKICGAPFPGVVGFLMRLLGRDPSRYSPWYCEKCKVFEHPGGAEIPLTMLFADVRGSTTIADKTSARDFSQRMNRFYTAATRVMIQTDSLVDRLIGDEAIGLYILAFAEAEHPRKAIEAAQELLGLTGHRDARGAWIPVGVGVHTGHAYVGVVGDEGSPANFTALGDNVKITSRLASEARTGEILISEEACHAANLDLEHLVARQVELKGKSEPINIRVLQVAPE